MRTRIIILTAIIWLALVNGCFFWSRISHSVLIGYIIERMGF